MEAKCPVCSSSLGEIDVLIGYAIFNSIDETGKLEWSGDTQIDWDAQAPQHNPPRFKCMQCSRVFTYNSTLRQFIEVKED